MPETTQSGFTELLNAQQLDATLHRLAFQILERHPRRKLAFAGIRKRGAPLAKRIARILESYRKDIAMGEVDITFHRDDLHNLEAMMNMDRTRMEIPDLDERCVVLFDDVLFTGRTIRAAIDEVLDFGRPEKIELAVLVDRGHRELPIQADYIGLSHTTAPGEYVRVLLREMDGQDAVLLAGSTDSKRIEA